MKPTNVLTLMNANIRKEFLKSVSGKIVQHSWSHLQLTTLIRKIFIVKLFVI